MPFPLKASMKEALICAGWGGGGAALGLQALHWGHRLLRAKPLQRCGKAQTQEGRQTDSSAHQQQISCDSSPIYQARGWQSLDVPGRQGSEPHRKKRPRELRVFVPSRARIRDFPAFPLKARMVDMSGSKSMEHSLRF